MTKILLLVAFVACAIGWTRSTNSAEAKHVAWIKYETTSCFGVCPVFAIRVFEDGRIEYEGRRFVMQRGLRFGRLSSKRLEELRQAVAEFKQLATHCCDCADRTDAPTTIIEVHGDEGNKTVRHYHGCESAPASISVLEDKIFTLTRAVRWVGSESERRKQKWNRNSQ